ncbi:cysteine-rich RLK (RECEPTOR-like protein kinase) 8 [Abeliophyllum distichum]|uniref:Cysteine-rich RLK (RECEPTOR-like protein kinase) 8 n=1 Tax=Abeliophyllum distichum TaxID=126358 RepID=A0ABD1PDT9_9LAMI
MMQQNTSNSNSEIQQPISESSSSNVGPSETSSISSPPPRGTRPLNDVYERCYMAIIKLNSYEEAAKYPEWIEVIEDEMEMIHKNQTWELVPRPTNQKVIGVKWIYKAKVNLDGSIYKYKARLVARGFAQESGVNYFETFAPVARHDTIRLLFALAAQKRWKIHQLDVKSAFLSGELEDDVFVEQPEGSSMEHIESFALELKKEFEMTNMGKMKYFLGVEIDQNED